MYTCKGPLLAVVLALATGCAEVSTDWSYLHTAIILPNCTTSACHSELSMAGGMSFQDRDIAYQRLTGRPCGSTGPAVGYVNVESPADSYLLILLRQEGATGMPPNTPLARDEVDWIEAWIAEGAPCD